MFVQFSVRNYRSLSEKVTLSLLAGSDKEHFDDLINIDNKKRLLPVSAIYGANSSGKSNVLMALNTMQDMIIGASAQLLKEKKLPYDPFAPGSAAKKHEPTEFEIIYYYNEVKYAYGFAYDEKQILSETLFHWPKGREALIFSRINDKYEFRENVNELKTLAGRTPSNKLYLVSSNEWNAAPTESAYKWFVDKLIPYDEQATTDFTHSLFFSDSESSSRARVHSEVLLSDLGITGIFCSEDHNNRNFRQIDIQHKYENNGVTDYFMLPLEQESRGTQKYFTRIGPWIKALEKGGVLFIDEIEASLHPMLTRRLVEMMQNPSINSNRAQLIFTTHDVMLLDLSLLRRDQIWFTDKDPKTLSTDLFSLWDFSVRKGENIRKGYLQGRFGAIPFFGGNGKWEE